MPRLRTVVVGLLVAYTLALLIIELCTSQDYVRHYFTDISGPVPFYAVNTTLSVFLLWGTAVLLLLAVVLLRYVPDAFRIRRFFASQVFIFGLMGFDDRFQLHEKVSFRLGVPDHYVLAVSVALELVFIVLFCRRECFTRRTAGFFLAGGALFGVMFAVDALMPEMGLLRLSIEDLAKTWACAMFFCFAWDSCLWQLGRLRPAGISQELPST